VPRSMGRLGAFACTIRSHPAQASLGRTYWTTLRMAGTYSRISNILTKLLQLPSTVRTSDVPTSGSILTYPHVVQTVHTRRLPYSVPKLRILYTPSSTVIGGSHPQLCAPLPTTRIVRASAAEARACGDGTKQRGPGRQRTRRWSRAGNRTARPCGWRRKLDGSRRGRRSRRLSRVQ
jgi:hypothetical protein